jgi:hypothetical protein
VTSPSATSVRAAAALGARCRRSFTLLPVAARSSRATSPPAGSTTATFVVGSSSSSWIVAL